MSKSATVTVPIVGFMVVPVENINSEEEAIKKGIDLVTDFISSLVDKSRDLPLYPNIFEWEWNAQQYISRGNFSYTTHNEASVEWDNEDDEFDDSEDGDPGELKENQDFAQDDCELWIK